MSLAHACSEIGLSKQVTQKSCHSSKAQSKEKHSHNKVSYDQSEEKFSQLLKNSKNDCPFCFLKACKPDILLSSGWSADADLKQISEVSFPYLAMKSLRSYGREVPKEIKNVHSPCFLRPLVTNWQAFYSLYII